MVCAGKKLYNCKYCRKIYQEGLEARKRIACWVCGICFNTPEDVVTHTEVNHPGMNPFKCKMCGFQSADIRALHEHYESHERSSVGQYSRPVTEMSVGEYAHPSNAPPAMLPSVQVPVVTNQVNNQEENKSGDKKKKFQCQLCGKCFGRSPDLQRHAAVHSTARPFKCDICSRAFKLKQALVRHMMSHDKVKRYECEECGKRFHLPSSLFNHKKTHSGYVKKGDYTCDLCHKSFATRGWLKRHFVNQCVDSAEGMEQPNPSMEGGMPVMDIAPLKKKRGRPPLARDVLLQDDFLDY